MNYEQELIKGSQFFYWSEVVPKGRPQPIDGNVFSSILATARYLDAVRCHLGNRRIYITSWYRDSATNSRVGGAKNSRHLYGDGVDFTREEQHPGDTYLILDKWHGDRGGLGLYPTHVHIDLRGYRARWDCL